jgi:type IV secretion system protein VirB1
MILALAVFAKLATACGPSVHPDTLTAVARAESGFNTLAIYDNTQKRVVAGNSEASAAAIASDLIRKGHSVDVGLMQVNSANFVRLKLTVSDAFDACKNIAAGARVLAEAYRPPLQNSDTGLAVNTALSRYNTGTSSAGFANGYVDKVQASADQIVPSLRGGTSSPAINAPPEWNVYGSALFERTHGQIVVQNAQTGPVLSESSPTR